MADFDALDASDPDAYDVILAFLSEAEGDPKLIEKLASHGEIKIGNVVATVKGWVVARRGRDNLFRLHIFKGAAERYRIIYGYDWHQFRIGILAIVKPHTEEFDYELDDEITKRILVEWRVVTGGAET